jgi:hypothetical protein
MQIEAYSDQALSLPRNGLAAAGAAKPGACMLSAALWCRTPPRFVYFWQLSEAVIRQAAD